MRIEIEIPVEFESDYRGDKFKDFFSRVLCDIENGTLCGNYEKETVEMFIKAFDESKTAYDVDKVVEKLEEESDYEPIDYDYCDMSCSDEEHFIATDKAIDIVRKWG